MFSTDKFNAFKIILFFMYSVFGTTVILLSSFFHLDRKFVLRFGLICNTVGVFLSGVCCGYVKNRADHTIRKFSAII